MEVKPGYKLTEVGVIPEDWEVAPLMTQARLQGGLAFPSIAFCKTGIPVVRISDIQNGAIDIDGAICHPKALIPPEYTISKGDTLIAMSGATTGKVGVYRHNGYSYQNQRVGKFIVKDLKRTASEFITHLVSSELFQVQLNALLEQGAQPNISSGQIESLIFAIPPLPEQTAIATTLSDVDALISSLDALISKTKQIKQGAMQELLSGERRLPGFSGEWGVFTLFRLAEGKKEYFNDGDWIESEHITTNGIRFIQTGNIGVGYFIEKHDRKYISEKSFASLSCKEINLGDLLICRLADPAGRACVLPDIGESKVVTSVDVTIFRAPPSSANRVYLALLFSTSDWFKSISDRSGGTTHKRIARGALGKIAITLPPLPEQQAIAAILSDMDAEITTLESRRNKTKLLKQGMMQELLTGRIRLPMEHSTVSVRTKPTVGMFQ